MTIYQILCLLGVPSLLGGIIGMLWKRMKEINQETDAIKAGVQALLRDRLIQSYRYFSAQGYADVNDRENFENMYQQYHALRKNGVMDGIHEKFMDLPTRPETKER